MPTYELIKTTLEATLKRFDLEPGTWGDLFFLTPEAWAAKGEKYGRGSLAVMVFDGSPVYSSLNYGEDGWALQEAILKDLDAIGVYYELMYAWCFAVYDG